MKKRTFRISLPQELILYISLVIILTSLLLTYFFIRNQIILIRTTLTERCDFLSRNLAGNSEFGVLTINNAYLSKLVKGTIQEEDVLYATIYDKNGRILAVAHKEAAVPSFPFLQVAENQSIKSISPLTGIEQISRLLPALHKPAPQAGTYDSLHPVTLHQTSTASREEITFMDDSGAPGVEEIIGFADVGISLGRMHQQINDLKRGALLVTLVIILIGILLSSLLADLIIRPIKALVIGTQKIAQGHLDYRVQEESIDEIAELSRSFNTMAEDLLRYVLESDRERERLQQLKSQLEERTGQLEETLSKMKNIQQELLRSEKFATVGRLASSVAHELRNPLASLKNISYYLLKLEAFNDEKAKHMLEMLSTDVNRANKIVTDLLDYSRVKRLAKVPVKTNEFMNKLLDHLELGSRVEVQRELEDMEASIDPDRITQVLVNLLTNARDAMVEGGRITVVTRKAGETLELLIRDNGHGMTKETRDRIFEPLFTTKTKGLGLGLAIVKEIIDAHFGTIDVESEKDKGTTFRITLPLK
jgi:signal transduction histidine kinase